MKDDLSAIILAGGLGTRLSSVVSDRPKALVPVAGRPFMEYLLAQLRSAGIGRATVCAGHLSGLLADHFGDGSAFGVELAYSVESVALGTAGALKLAEPLLAGDEWLLMNGDSLLDISLQALARRHAAAPALVTMALTHADDGRRYGRVTLAQDGTVKAFAEKADSIDPGLINTGLYIIQRPLLDLIPANRPVSLERDVLPALVGRAAGAVRGATFDAYFIDIGAPESYARAAADAAVFERLIEQA